MAKYNSANITAQNTGITNGIDVNGQFNVSISGTWVATVWLQRCHDGTNWRDVKSYNANVEETLEDKVGCVYRLFVKTGGYTSGTVACYMKAE